MTEESRVLFLAPTHKDAAAGRGLMAAAGLACHPCGSLAELCAEVPRGAGAVVVPEEAVVRDRDGCLAAALGDQPPWSHLPVLVLTAAGPLPGRRVRALLGLGDVILLKRPLEAAEFLNAVQAALRDRGRQYQVRDYVAELDRRAEALKDADRRKDEFLAMLAHELRNPLAPIRNGLEILRLTEGDPVAVARTRDMLRRQVEHLARLVDDLLDVSRITRGKVELRKQPVELGAALSRAVEGVRPLVDARHHKLTVVQPGRPVWAEADPARLTQVVGNLLTNAAKYSEEGGRIDLCLEEDGEWAVVRVRDTGLGIPPEMLPRVFDLFTQVGRTLDRADGGLGIGLTLVRTLVELHGGTVQAHSDGVGKGSEFVVRLPRTTAPGPAGTGPGAGRPVVPRRVLVVDDNPDAGDTLATLLTLAGHTVEVARGSLQAVEAARRFRPEAALLDIGLPGMSGYDLARQLRAEPFGRDLLRVALTGYGQEDDRRRATAAGFDHHLTKPADPAVLSELLARRGPG